MKLNTANLADVVLSTPPLQNGTYFGKITKVEVKPNKQNTGNNLKLVFTICDAQILTHEGKALENNGKMLLFRTISLVPTPDYDPNRSLKELAIALQIPEDKEDFELEDIRIGECIKLKCVYREAKDGFPATTDIQGFQPITPEDNFTPPAF